MEVIVKIPSFKVYNYKGWAFEYDRNKPFLPWPLKKNYEYRVQAGDVFYTIFERFSQLSIKEQESYRVKEF